jgi:hypothetical protein
MKTYTKTHKSEKALKSHVAKIKARGGKATVKGKTIEYKFGSFGNTKYDKGGKLGIKKNLIGKKARIISDNDNYDRFRNKTLVITHAEVGGRGYDMGVYPEALCDFKILGSNQQFPFALYEYEFEII